MTTAREYADLSQLAEASYADLQEVNDKNSLIVELQSTDFYNMEFSEMQAEMLAEHWEVVAHQKNTDSGFSSTLFKNTDPANKGGGRYVLAIRGTEGVNVLDLFQADIGDIVHDGIAIDQVIDLYNEWQRITQSGHYGVAYLETLVQESALYVAARAAALLPGSAEAASAVLAGLRSRTDIVIDDPLGLVKKIRFATSDQLFNDDRVNGLGMKDEIDAKDLTVAGHSLGGHLAAAFTRLFPSAGATAVTINGAGFATGDIAGLTGNAATNIRNLFGVLGGASNFYSGEILNLYGEKNYEFVTMNGPGLHQQGAHVSVFTEQVEIDDAVFGHDAKQMSDSLAVYDLFFQLDDNLANSQPSMALDTLQKIFEASAKDAEKTLESATNCIADLLRIDAQIGVDDIQNWDDKQNRQALYTAIDKIETEDDKLEKFRGKLIFSTLSESVAEQARSDFGQFLTLFHLSPFSISVADASAVADLKALYEDVGTAWQHDSQLSATDLARGLAEFTDEFLQDSALFSSTMLNMNNLDQDHGSLTQQIKFTKIYSNRSDELESIVFDGDANGYVYPNPLPPAYFDHHRARYVFGSDASDDESKIVASENNDHLYGMAGNDTVDGGKGSDHIEGGLGTDEVRGGDDGDVLRGNGGIDTLVGGKGVDSLSGGAGADRFKWYSGDGDDFIVDYDYGGDRIYANDIDLSTLTYKQKSVDSPFYVAVEHPDISLHYDGFLTIYTGSGDDAGSMSVMRYSPATGADYGIRLGTYAADPIHPTSVTVEKIGTSPYSEDNETDWIAYFRQLEQQRGLNWSSLSITFNGNEVSSYTGDTVYGALRGTFEGGLLDDVLLGNAYGNKLHGLAGEDIIDGGAGGDYLTGNAGSDIVFGGDGNDIIYGSLDVRMLQLYEDGSDQQQFYRSQGLDETGDVNTLTGDAGIDYITGGEHIDYIDGGVGQDWLMGGTGEDFISGGSDADFLYGDSAHHFFWVNRPGNTVGIDLKIAYADGHDTIGLYDDVIHGGDGDDLVIGELGDDILFGEAGNDQLTGDRDTDTSYYTLSVPACDDTSLDLNVSLHGNDQLFGGAGADTLRGLGGNDLLSGGADDDVLLGGAGDDTYLFQEGDGRDVIQDEQGTHTLVFSGYSKNTLRIEFQGAQVFVGRGAAADEAIGEGFFVSRNQWDSTELALEIADGTFERIALDAIYFDSSGRPVLTLEGSNVLTESERDALFTVDTSNLQTPKIVIKSGVDQVNLEGNLDGSGGKLRITRGAIEIVVTVSPVHLQSIRNDIQLPEGVSLTISGRITGTELADTIIGSDRVDEIRGLEGDDVLDGRGGNDTIIGGDGRDELIGGDGDDVLVGKDTLDSDYFSGGRGRDTLQGGAGADRYAFAAGDGQDTLSDSYGQLDFEFADDVDPGDVVLYYTDATDARIRLEYGAGDAITSEGDFSASEIASVTVADAVIPLIQRADRKDGTFFDSWSNDIFEPGDGNDVIHLQNRGNNAYRFFDGDGQDVITVGEDTGGNSLKGEIRFAADIDLDALSFRFINADAIIGYGSGDHITLDTNTVTSNLDNTFVRFTLVSEADPDWIPVLYVDDSSANFYGSYGTDHIIGSNNPDIILPGYGDDIIESGSGDDFVLLNDLYRPNIHSSIGAKKISGQRGDDTIMAPLHQGLTFKYNAGDGHDTIQFDWSYGLISPYRFTVNIFASTATFRANGTDTLEFGAGIALADLRFVRSGSDLRISLRDGTGSVKLQEFFHAWDEPTTPETARELFALMDGATHLGVDTLLHPTVLAALPKTPISYLRFANNTVFNMSSSLSAVLEISNETVSGTAFDDRLYGTAADDVIFAYGGNDYIEDMAGHNTIDAGPGNDTIVVGSDNLIEAGPGDDIIGVNGNNIIQAGEGNDQVFATGNNVIKGGRGNDEIWLSSGDNVLEFEPGDGNDNINFNVAGTTILSLAADITPADLTVYRSVVNGIESLQIVLLATGDSILPHAMIVGGDGSVTPHPHATFTQVRFADGTVITGDQLFAMVRPTPIQINGTDRDDRLTGTSADEIFFGGAGNDVLRGNAGNDFFLVTGHDQGADRILGGAGFDAIVGSTADDTITLTAMASTASVELIDGGEGINVIAGTSGANSFNFATTQLRNISRIDGKAGNDNIRGSKGGDWLVGGAGNDTLRGEAGNDTFSSGSGDDTLFGGAGDDTYLFALGDGYDRINNNDSAASALDGLWFTDSNYDDLWLSRNGDSLMINVVGSTDQVQINHWYAAAGNQLDEIHAGNRALLRNRVDQLVTAMAAFDVPTGVGVVIPQDTRIALESTLTAVWKAA